MNVFQKRSLREKWVDPIHQSQWETTVLFFFRAGLLLRDERTDEDLAGPGRKDREASVCDGSSEQGVAAKDPGGRRIAFGLKQKDERKNGFMG